MKVLVVVFMLVFSLYAKGTKAGTVITNQATLDFTVGESASYTLTSNKVENIVSQVISFVLEWQDSSPVEIYEGAKERVLTLALLNDGNGKDRISLSFSQSITLSSLVEKMDIFVDANNNGKYDKDDIKVDEIALESDTKKRFFLVTSLKDGVETEKTLLSVDIDAKSQLGGSGVKGTVFEGKGVDGVDAIDGLNGGVSKKTVSYKMMTQKPLFKKSVEYFEKDGYYKVSLSLDLQGNADLKDLELTDRMPRGLYYRKNSIRVDEKYQTDKKDGDLASFDFNIKRLSLNLSKLKLPKRILVTYILDKEIR